MIPATWKKATIGELCQMIKGSSPTMKTKSGEYPLVTMGEEHKTADTYQLDTEAVCVPMISSFGHGKAGLKRVHYIKGKFALSNILMALVVKEPHELSTKYLALYLQTFKDQLIVPLQTGAANMSLRPEKLAGVPVRYPSHKEQERIVSIMDEMDYLLQLRQQAQQCTNKLIPSIFFQLFGNPLKNDKKWNVKSLRNLGKITTGSTPPSKKQNMFDGEIPFVTPGDLENDTKNTKRFLSAEGAQNSRTVRSGTTLVCCIGATIGKADRTWIESAFNQQINAIEWGEEIADDYGLFCMKFFKPEVVRLGVSAALPILKKSRFEQIQIPVPPLSIQKEFSIRVEEIRSVLAEQKASTTKLFTLYNSILTKTFEGKV